MHIISITSAYEYEVYFIGLYGYFFLDGWMDGWMDVWSTRIGHLFHPGLGYPLPSL